MLEVQIKSILLGPVSPKAGSFRLGQWDLRMAVPNTGVSSEQIGRVAEHEWCL